MPERVGDAPHGLLRDVLVERARRRARSEDALDGVVLEGAEGGRVTECGVEVVGGEALAEQEDLARLVSPDPRRPGAHEAEEAGGVLAHLLEGDAQLIEIDGALPPGARVKPGGVELEPSAAGRELMARDAGEVGGVDEELALGDADRQDVGDVVVGHGVGVAFPGDEAVDGADAVDDARGVVGAARQGHEVLPLRGEAVEGGLSVAAALIDDGVEPPGELRSHVLEVDEGAAVEEGDLGFPEAPLDTRLGIGIAPYGAGAILVVSGEGEEARVVDGLVSFPAQDDRFLAIVDAGRRAASESREGADVTIHERVQIRVPVEVEVLATGVDEHVGECLDFLLVTVGENDLVRRPVILGHLAGAVLGRRQARLRARRGTQHPHGLLHGGITAGESILA